MTKTEKIKKIAWKGRAELHNGGENIKFCQGQKITATDKKFIMANKPAFITYLKADAKETADRLSKANENARIEREKHNKWIASTPNYMVLVKSGSYFIDTHIHERVCLIQDQSKFSEWARGRMVMSVGNDRKINAKKSKTVQAIIKSESSGMKFAYGESRMWIITEEQNQTIKDEIRAENKRLDMIEDQAKKAKQATIDEAQAQAKKTGAPVILNTWTTDRCYNGGHDCSFDHATKYINPDGSTSTTFSCCH